MTLKIVPVDTEHLPAPEIMKELREKSFEDQLQHFRLQRFHKTTYSVTQRRISKEGMHGEVVDIKDYEILVCDDVIVGVRIERNMEVYCFRNRWLFDETDICTYNEQRTTMDGWGLQCEHEWYRFAYVA